jgi:hypothetical protein
MRAGRQIKVPRFDAPRIKQRHRYPELYIQYKGEKSNHPSPQDSGIATTTGS